MWPLCTKAFFAAAAIRGRVLLANVRLGCPGLDRLCDNSSLRRGMLSSRGVAVDWTQLTEAKRIVFFWFKAGVDFFGTNLSLCDVSQDWSLSEHVPLSQKDSAVLGVAVVLA